MEMKEKMTYPEIFEQIVTEAPKFEFCNAVKNEDIMKGFIRNLWADWCTRSLADLAAVEEDKEEKMEIVQFLMKARKSVMTDDWDKAKESVRALREIAEAMESAVMRELDVMMENAKVPFDVLTKEETELPFVPVEYERD